MAQVVTSAEVLGGAATDTDGDGFSDEDELNVYFTDPGDADSDDDGLNDAVEIGEGTNPNDADSDDDGLSDGEEVNGAGSNPNDPDSDDDGVGDLDDPLPNDPGVTSGYIEDALRAVADLASQFPLTEIDAKNNNAAMGRRNAINNKLNAAANAVAAGDHQEAMDELISLLLKLDDDPTPRDWMYSGELKTALRDEILLQVALIELQ